MRIGWLNTQDLDGKYFCLEMTEPNKRSLAQRARQERSRAEKERLRQEQRKRDLEDDEDDKDIEWAVNKAKTNEEFRRGVRNGQQEFWNWRVPGTFRDQWRAYKFLNPVLQEWLKNPNRQREMPVEGWDQIFVDKWAGMYEGENWKERYRLWKAVGKDVRNMPPPPGIPQPPMDFYTDRIIGPEEGRLNQRATVPRTAMQDYNLQEQKELARQEILQVMAEQQSRPRPPPREVITVSDSDDDVVEFSPEEQEEMRRARQAWMHRRPGQDESTRQLLQDLGF
jgi:hypothetical protein